MDIQWKQAESMEQPLKIDETLSANGVYLRKNIQTVPFTDSDGNEQVKYTYLEAFLTKEEYSMYKLEKSIAVNVLKENDSEAYENYKAKLDTPVEYTNGHLYKPKWAEEVYAGLLQKGAILPNLFPLKIWDATEIEENAVSMSIAELTALTIFLAGKQEQYFNEYKLEKTA